MRTLQDIDLEIEHIEDELQHVSGTTTEVYARIVGYYRSVRNWNKGKREEFGLRKMFTEENPKIAYYCKDMPSATPDSGFHISPAKIEVYVRAGCPRCPPVCEYCRTLDTSVVFIDADTAEGAKTAAAHAVRACPTVIAYSDDGTELARAYSLADLKTYYIPHYTPKAVNA